MGTVRGTSVVRGDRMTCAPVAVVALDALDEYGRARKEHGPMRSRHEGYAVILEELDELWDEIKAKHPDKDRMRAEAIQVAAMALALVVEVCA